MWFLTFAGSLLLTQAIHATAKETQFYELTFIVNGNFRKPEYAYSTQIGAYSDYNGSDYPGSDVAWTVNSNTVSRQFNGQKQPTIPAYFLPSTISPSLIELNSNTTQCGKTACQLCMRDNSCDRKAGFLSTCADGALPGPGQHCAVRQIDDINGDGQWRFDPNTHEITNTVVAAPKYHFFSCNYTYSAPNVTQRLEIGQFQKNGEPPRGCNNTKVVAFPRSHNYFGPPFNGDLSG